MQRIIVNILKNILQFLLKKTFSININMKKFQLTGQFHNKESNKLKYDKCDEIWNNETMVELYIMKVHDKENSKYEHAV